MKIRAKYAGHCAICGLRFPAGADIDYEKASGAVHLECKAQEKPIPEGATIYKIGGGSGYGCEGYRAGQIVASGKRDIEERGYPAFLYVLRASQRYYREDGLSFGVGDDSGYLYMADCREATADEAAPLIQAREAAARKKAATAELGTVKKLIQDTGERPEGMNHPEGDRLIDTQNIYGGGDWFVVGPAHIWYVQNNGNDGDNWSYNNVRTGGAGAIGWRIPFSADIAERIQRLAEVLRGA